MLVIGLSAKALIPMEVTLLGIVMLDNKLFSNTRSPMVVTLLPKVTFEIVPKRTLLFLSHCPKKAISSIVVTLFGMITLLIFFSKNAFFPMILTGYPLISSGITISPP